MAGLLKKTRTKRGKGGKQEKCFKMFSTNAAGLKKKFQSFKSEIKNVDAAIFTVQETHASKRVLSKLKISKFLKQ